MERKKKDTRVKKLRHVAKIAKVLKLTSLSRILAENETKRQELLLNTPCEAS